MTDRVIHGVNGELERIATFRLGDVSASTLSTSFEQPYSNEFRSVLASHYLRESFGYRGTQISLSGRLHCYDTAEASIAAWTSQDDIGIISGSEYVSAPGADFEPFHTPTADLPQGGGLSYLDYHLKSSDGTEVEAHGHVYAHIWGEMD